ncbi:MAG: hypothetical protein EA403_16450 [Spirochaetaceae bacterium]|nr:MAG: hypothetical protein EA403_16450 [Spirochaetaceae bacterium]
MRIGIDLGTGSLKVMFRPDGGETVTLSSAYPVRSPRTGYAETDTGCWWQALLDVFARYRERDPSGLKAARTVGFSGQMHGVVPCLASGEAIGPAVLWADRRGAEFLPLLDSLPSGEKSRLMNAPAAGMAATTIAWFAKHDPTLYTSTACFLQPKDFLRMRLTGRFATDHSDAAGTLLYDFYAKDWSETVLVTLGIDRDKLPPIQHSGGGAGTIVPEVADLLGVSDRTRVCIGAADTAAAIYGSGLKTGAQVSVGTAAQVAVLADTLPAFDASLNCYPTVESGHWYRMAAMLNAGLALEWVRAILKFSWDEFYQRLQESGGRPPSPDPPIFLPYLTGERTPYLDPNARAVWLGLSLEHGMDDLAWAAIEGVAFSLRLGIESLGVPEADGVRLVGGSRKYRGWCQLISTVMKRQVTILDEADVSAFGALRLGAGLDGEEIAPPAALETIDPTSDSAVDERYQRFLACYRNNYLCSVRS